MLEKEQLRNSNPRRDRLLNFASYGTLLLMLGGCVSSHVAHHREVVPPPSVTDFESYLREMRAPRSLMILQDKNSFILVATGDLSQLSLIASMSIPSGPPQYIFNKDGKLV